MCESVLSLRFVETKTGYGQTRADNKNRLTARTNHKCAHGESDNHLFLGPICLQVELLRLDILSETSFRPNEPKKKNVLRIVNTN
jgi:hypothetical protein